ncbi:DUF1559 domain-containing protein [Isosphaeraceae bacterium EP7]
MTLSWTLAACLLVGAPPQGEGAGVVSQLIGDEVAAVARVSLTGGTFERSVRQILGAHAESPELAGGLKSAGGLIGALEKAGAKELVILLDPADFPGFPVVVVPLTAGGNADEIKRLLTTDASGLPFHWPAAETIRGAVVAGKPEALARIKQAKPAARPDVEAALAASSKTSAFLAIVPSTVQRRALEESMTNLPPELGGAPPEIITRGLTWATLAMTDDAKPKLRVVLQGKDETAAVELRKVMALAIARGIPPLLAENPALKLATTLGATERAEAGARTTYELDMAAVAQELSKPLISARLAAQRSQSVNNLKQIGLAMHNYHDATKAFPPAYLAAKDGKPLLSWRVLILPYLDQAPLFKEFHLDEPWDSDHNRTLISKMPKVYDAPAATRALAAEGKTTYLTPRGATTMFPGAQGVKIQEITDGTSNTIMTLEADDQAAVIWTKPDDWEVKAPLDLQALFGRYQGGTSFGFADGSVRFLKKSINLQVMDALLTKSGGEVISSDAY